MTVSRFILLLLSALFTATLAAQPYAREWKAVREAWSADLPKNTIALVEHIEHKARKDGEVHQEMVATFVLWQLQGMISPDSALAVQQRLERSIPSLPEMPHRIIWQALFAQKMSKDFSVSYPERKGYTQQLVALLGNMEAFHATKYKELHPLIEQGKNADEFANDVLHIFLFDLLDNANISTAEKQKLAKDAERFYASKGLYAAAVRMALHHSDAEQVLGLYAHRTEAAIAYVAWVNEQRSKLNLEENPARQQLTTWVAEGLQKYKDVPTQRHLKNLRAALECPTLHTKALTQLCTPSQPLQYALVVNNLRQANINVVRATEQGQVLDKRPVFSAAISFPKAEKWRRQTDTIAFTLPAPGVYKLEVSAKGDIKESCLLHCTQITPYLLHTSNEVCRIMALDAHTGAALTDFAVYQEVEGAKTPMKWQSLGGSVWLDAENLTALRGAENRNTYRTNTFRIRTAEDTCSSAFSLWLSPQRPLATQQMRAHLFTDRAIYRKGQEVHWSGLLYLQHEDSLRVCKGEKLQVVLLDNAQKQVATADCLTDCYGRFNGRFQLPEGQEQGRFSFRIKRLSDAQEAPNLSCQGMTTVQVEAYKRQAFSVNFQPITAAYAYGDTLEVKGVVNTLTAQPMANALVRYEITQSSLYRTSSEPPLEGVLRTDERGNFSVLVVLKEPVGAQSSWRWNAHYYKVNATVVGDNGETQTASVNVRVGSQPTQLSLNLPDVVCKEDVPPLRFQLVNMMGVEVRDSVDWLLMDAQGNTIASGKAVANKEFLPFAENNLGAISDYLPIKINALPDNFYTLEVRTNDGAEARHKFLLLSQRSAKLPEASPAFLIHKLTSSSASEAQVLVGTTLEDVYLYKDVVSSTGKLLSSECIRLSNELRTLHLTYDAAYGVGATVYLAALVEGELHTQNIRLERPQPERELQLHWTTFRDRLTPGQTEAWELRVTSPDGKPVEASLMARLYDASLDALAYNGWRTAFLQPLSFANVHGQVYQRYLHSVYASKTLRLKEVTPFTPSRWNDFSGDDMFVARPMYSVGGSATMRLKGVKNSVMTDAVLEESVIETGASDPVENSPLMLRENFDESAFMYPALATDAEGNAVIRFTLPQQLTTWRFTAFAHDTTLRQAFLETDVVVEKRVTVALNAPRFVREGDRLTLPVVVRTTKSEGVSGKLTTVLLNEETGAEIFRLQQPFALAVGKTSVAVLAKFPQLDAQTISEMGQSVPTAVVCRVMVEGTDFSDGEAHRIPVLSDRVEVVRSLPFTLSEVGTKNFDLAPLWTDMEAAQSPKTTITFTPSALTEAARALTSLSLRPVCGTDDWARRYYALTLLLHLAERGNALPEFDSLRTKSLQDEAVTYLRRQQRASGAWGWFEGMPDSRFITNEILLQLARLDFLVGEHPLSASASNALQFMHREMEQLRREMETAERKQKEQLPLGELPLRYLDACYYLDADTTAAADYFLRKAAQMNATYSLYGKAVMSKVLRKGKREEHANLLLQSMRQYLVETPEMGAYFDAPKAQTTYSSYRIPTQTAAIEAFYAVGDTETVRKMQQWLLQSKRTQDWETSRATADAIFALCLNGKDTVGILLPKGQSLMPTDTTFAGCYNTLTVMIADEVTETNATVRERHLEVQAPKPTVSSRNLDLSFGAVRAQYTLPVKAVEAYDSGLRLSVRLEVKTAEGWREVQPAEAVDKTLPLRQVVVVRADRDYDYVRLSVPRPACAEPAERLSGYCWNTSVGAYRIVTDKAADFFVEKLPKGTYTFVEVLYTDRPGTYEQGIATVTCTYAPEFAGNTAGRTLLVK